MIRGRGASDNRAGRFAVTVSEYDEPAAPDQAPDQRTDKSTRTHSERCRTLLVRNESPDIPFERSINPYRGCEHGCIYCFARPTHSYLDLSPGLDFETGIFCKDNAPQVLEHELSRPGYRCRPVVIGAATDPYQPVERERRITRALLEVLWAYRHPVSLVTRSPLVLRDLDLLAPMAEQGLASVAISVTTLDNALKARLEPRAPAGSRRLDAMAGLTGAGVPVTLLFAPVIPFLNDPELETIVSAAARAGATAAGHVVLRLPHELGELWQQWLAEHYPQRAGRIMKVVRELHGGRQYRSDWFVRQQGRGVWAELLARRMALARNRHGMEGRYIELRTDLFRVPGRESQLTLFGAEE